MRPDRIRWPYGSSKEVWEGQQVSAGAMPFEEEECRVVAGLGRPLFATARRVHTIRDNRREARTAAQG